VKIKKISIWVLYIWAAALFLVGVAGINSAFASEHSNATTINNSTTIVQIEASKPAAVNAAMDAIDFDHNTRGIQFGPGVGWNEDSNGGSALGVAFGAGGRVCLSKRTCGLLVGKFGKPEGKGKTVSAGFTLTY